MGVRSLADVPIGQSAVVERVACSRPTAIRLMEMGLVPGTEIEVHRKAPLGDPLELRIRGYSLSIRRDEAALVSVRALAAVAATPAADDDAPADEELSDQAAE